MKEEVKKKECFLCSRISLGHILCMFSLLTVFVMCNLILSSSKLSLVVDVTAKMKSSMLTVMSSLINASGPLSVNGSFKVKSFTSKQAVLADYRRWAQEHSKWTDPTLNHSLHFLNITGKNVSVSSIVKPQTETLKTSKQLIKIDGTSISDPNDQRKDICDQCLKHDFSYIIDNENICKQISADQAIKVIILIMTEHKNILQRNAIRNTWLTYSKNNTGEVRYAFLLGEVKDPALQKAVVEEDSVHRDILKEDFVDSYTNLTFKTIMAFKWASTKCAHAQFVMKTDDDMYVNILNVLNLVTKHSEALHKGIGGACHKKAAPIRDKGSKWFASVKSYPKTTYPGFCSGTGYLTSTEVVRKVYEVSPTIPFFHLEDVYVSLCIRKLGLKLTPLPGFNAGKPRLDPCTYKNRLLVTSHHLSDRELQFIWKAECHRFNRTVSRIG